MAMKLNKAQAEAAAIGAGAAIVLAGAGTGKTATLAARLATLVQSGVSPHQVLLLTFTRRSAEDMIDRACQVIGDPDAPFSGGTFHSFAAAVLRQFGSKIGLRDCFTIMDQDDVYKIIGTLRADCPGSRERKFPKSRTIAAILSKAVNTRRPVGAVVAEEYRHFVHAAAQLDELALHYVKWKAARGLVDFDDLLHLLIVLLRECPDAAAAIADRWSYLMVDEYQDTNVLQAEIVKLLAKSSGNVVVVGDDAQSIYAFRGARPENMYRFTRDFPQATQVTLEQNYRSTQPILNLSNRVLDQMRKRFRKRLYTDRLAGPLPTLVRAADTASEARYVADGICAARDAGIALDDMAVLFRAGRQAYALEAELQARGVAFVKYGGLRFAESAHVKDVIAMLRMLTNGRDSLSLYRILEWGPGIGPTTSRKIEWELDGRFTAKALAACSAPKRAETFLKTLAGKVDAWQAQVAAKPAEVVREVLAFYQEFLEGKFDDWPKRQKDLNALAAMIGEGESLTEFVARLSLDPPSRFTEEGEPTAGAGRVALSTIHSAKGLEWSKVWIIRAHDGSLPMTIDTSDGALDEELRLLYVAVTRAADELILTWPEDQDGRNDGASRFLREIPHDTLARETLAGAGKVSPRGRHSGNWRQDISF